jgi:CheY-like chemotaxis protein
MDLYSCTIENDSLWLHLFQTTKERLGMKIENKTILLVEDNPEDGILALRALKKNNIGKKVFVVHDGAEALDFLFCTNTYAERNPREMPQLILLDIQLPKIDGLEVLRRLRANQRTRRLPVVMLTSSNEEQDLIQSYESGANSYIRKPVDFSQFVDAIRQLGIYWLALNEAPPR